METAPNTLKVYSRSQCHDPKRPNYLKYIEHKQVASLLEVGFCKEVCTALIPLDEILTNSLKEINSKNHEFKPMIAGVGQTGWTLSGYQDVIDDVGFRDTWNEAQNDMDFVFFDNLSHDEFREIVSRKVNSAAKKYTKKHSKHYFNWATIDRINPNKWKESLWPDIDCTVRITYRRGGRFHKSPNKINPMDILHFQTSNHEGALQTAENLFVPAWSTRVGNPISISTINKKDSVSTYAWNPYVLGENQNWIHEINLTNPSYFNNSQRSIVMTPRVALFATQASIAAREQAYLSLETIDSLKSSTEHWAPTLSDDQRKSAKKRLDTTLYRASVLGNNIKWTFWHELGFNFSSFEDPIKFTVENLDKIGWGEKVLGMPVQKYIETASVLQTK